MKADSAEHSSGLVVEEGVAEIEAEHSLVLVVEEDVAEVEAALGYPLNPDPSLNFEGISRKQR